jgi:hypothetical protein
MSQANMFKSMELVRLHNGGHLDPMLKKLHNIVDQSNLLACGGDVSVFHHQVNGEKRVVKVVPKSIRFFKHFGKGHSAKDFEKYINRLDPYFLPVDGILYEDDNVFVYAQKECKLIESKRINKTVVMDVFRLLQFMLVNDVLLTDLAPHNLGLVKGRVVVFDYHGLHRLTKNGVVKHTNWWRRLSRNLVRFVCGLYNPHKRPEYSLLMQNCDQSVIKKMESDSDIPKPLTSMIKYFMSQQNDISINKVCAYLEQCLNYVKTH